MRFRFSSMALAVTILATGYRRIDAQTAPAPKQLVEELRLDATTQDFPSVRYFTVGPQGQIAVLIDEDQQLRFYDATGKKVGTFGRKGAGPGEFTRMVRCGWIGDTLWVADFTLKRITYISPALKLLRSDVVAPALNAGGRDAAAGSIYMFNPWSVTPRGMLVGPAMITIGKNAAGATDTKSVILATNVDGSGQKTLATPPSTENASVYYRPGDGSSFATAVPFTFYPQTQYAPDGSRLAMLAVEPGARSATYRVTSIRIGGADNTPVGGRRVPAAESTEDFSRTYQATPVPIPASAVDSALAAIGPMQDGKPVWPAAARASLAEAARARIPAVYAPVSGLVMGLDNTTWVLLRRTGDGQTAIALDAKGNPVASIVIPKSSRLVQASLSKVWMVEIDEDGLGSIVRYRLK